MVVCNECIKNVLSRIYLEGVTYNGRAPQIYWEAKHALERLDKTCLTVNSNSDPYSPLGWRRNNYPILVVGRNNNRLKFTYTKKQLNNGEILNTVDEVADAYGNILTESCDSMSNKRSKTIRLIESELKQILVECITKIIKEDLSSPNIATKKVGKYNAIDDSWRDSFPHGLENFGAVQDVRMYEKNVA